MFFPCIDGPSTLYRTLIRQPNARKIALSITIHFRTMGQLCFYTVVSIQSFSLGTENTLLTTIDFLRTVLKKAFSTATMGIRVPGSIRSPTTKGTGSFPVCLAATNLPFVILATDARRRCTIVVDAFVVRIKEGTTTRTTSLHFLEGRSSYLLEKRSTYKTVRKNEGIETKKRLFVCSTTLLVALPPLVD